MHVVYTISAFGAANTGMGGHYESLKTIAAAMSARHGSGSVSIVSFGNFLPASLVKSPVSYRHVPVSIQRLFGASREALKGLDGVTHVHAFDRRSFYFARRMARLAGAKLYLTKPGGPNTPYFPFAEDIIAFSRENADWLSGQASGRRKSRVHYIPQRIAVPAANPARVEALRDLLGPGGPLILRISRIGPYYESSARQTLSLAADLRRLNIPARALVLGVVEDQQVLERLRSQAASEDRIVTDPEFTRAASELIPAADIVVGTGRSFMEAAMAGRPVLAPVSDSRLPVLVTNENVELIQRTNFSERLQIRDYDGSETVSSVAAMLADKDRYNLACAESASIASRLFDVRASLDAYDAAYAAPQVGARRPLDAAVLLAGAVWGLR